MSPKSALQNLSKKEYDALLKSGMMWEFHPAATGDFNKDCKRKKRRKK